VNKVLLLCRADPSEFVRRSAVHFITQFHSIGSVHAACLHTMCEAAVHDADCDVKCAAVRFWRRYLTNINQSMTPSCCRAAVLVGSVGCLLLAVSDCDRVVRVEALRTLVDVRSLVETQPTLLLPANHCSSGQVPEDRSCDGICTNPDFITASLRYLRQNSELSCDEVDVNRDRYQRPVFTDAVCSESVITKLKLRLLSTDWQLMLASESEQSSDCHAGNPVSLLDDILRTARRDNDGSHDNISNEDQDDQNSIIIDCY